MTETTAVPQGSKPSPIALLFALAIFTSAALVFSVQPIMGRVLLPLLGGSPAVWNTSMVFFQAALLVGYGYAHLLQRVRSLKVQAGIHLGLLGLALISFWPLGLSELVGLPDTHRPIPWLLAALALSIGAPFAVLSATAPLLQAWFARIRQGTEEGDNPYVLYAASNIGSFAALIAYPALIEPIAGLSLQTMGWSVGFGLFILLILGLAAVVWRGDRGVFEAPALVASAPITWRQRLVWVGMAAVPTSLMLGVTTYLSVDVASAPFLWVMPLALYLLTFVIAFSRRPAIPLTATLVAQAAAAAVCTALMQLTNGEWAMLFFLHLGTFFFTALMCHQRLAELKPAPDRLTEFFLWLSLGGVLGGAFTALLAPAVFQTVIEYPLVLCLAALARPWARTRLKRDEILWLAAIVPLCLIPPLMFWWLGADARPHQAGLTWDLARGIVYFPLAAAAICAFMVRDRARLFFLALSLIALAAAQIGVRYDWTESGRSFFGVVRRADVNFNQIGPVRILMHGTTLHGAQAQAPEWRCRPGLYYAPTTPIGETVIVTQNRTANAVMGVVGEGTGSMAAYKRAGDDLTFFEIDPLVDRWARDPERFSYISDCADGPVRTVIGDARLTLRNEPSGTYDLLLVDAFSSDAVPTHMLTVEAIREFLRVLKPEGLLVLHLSNRNLEITSPTLAAAHQLGVPYRHKIYGENPDAPQMTESSTEVLVLSPTAAGLVAFDIDPRWRGNITTDTAPWTDDYVNLFGALVREARAD
ncbi:MAG TPA: fused MFS/spermidine synthase [Brevundimonas sp.]|uniref:fused MFS/spermidine synthase n=1 Tax=Brevundimonas sp. TaxID=1871086 RepID=UPI002C35EE2C|nr:fused MFS/spermidine synthase [Brevundimonas sp.]HRH20322.1 fused MFS/spermidine synthase [Brevundimonas sp.]